MNEAEEVPDFDGSVIDLATRRLGSKQPGINSAEGIHGGGGGGGGGMDDFAGRLGKLEAEVEGLQSGNGDLKGDFRIAVGAGVVAAIAVAGMVVTSYLMLSSQADANRREVTDLIRFEIGRLAPEKPPANP